jgi:hypothetical protein
VLRPAVRLLVLFAVKPEGLAEGLGAAHRATPADQPPAAATPPAPASVGPAATAAAADPAAAVGTTAAEALLLLTAAGVAAAGGIAVLLGVWRFVPASCFPAARLSPPTTPLPAADAAVGAAAAAVWDDAAVGVLPGVLAATLFLVTGRLVLTGVTALLPLPPLLLLVPTAALQLPLLPAWAPAGVLPLVELVCGCM